MSNSEILILAGGRHNLRSLDRIEKAGTNATEENIAAQEEKFTSMHILKRYDPDRYGECLQELQNSSYHALDAFPQTQAKTYK